jgi:putative inorganic carbon (HCO3(-)) transporter
VIFWLFLILNAVLLLRPEDLRPGLAGLHLYQLVIAACLVGAAPKVVGQLVPRALADRPVTVCLVGFLGAIVLSLLARGRIGEAVWDGAEFAKVVAFYLLLVALVDRPERLRTFLGWLVLLVAVLAVLALLQFHGVIDVEAMRPVEQAEYDEDTGELLVSYPRLRSFGLFQDPNDLCLILTAGTLACLARSAVAGGAGRVLWLAPIGLYGYALMLTQSRGGLIGLAAGIGTLVYVRLGPRRGLPLAVVGVLALVAVFGGRQSNFNLSTSDTSQGRLQLWAEGLALLTRNPITGIGAGEYEEEVGQVAHNSFVHAFVETGLLGGTLYAGMFVLAAAALYRLPRYATFWAHDREFTALQPFVLAMVAAYAAGTFSLSRNYVIPTYLVLGLATAYARIALWEPPEEYRMSRGLVVRLVLLGAATLVFLKLFTQLLVRF